MITLRLAGRGSGVAKAMPSLGSSKWFTIWAVLAALVSAGTISARAADLAAARKAIEAQYARFDAAITRKDPAPFEGLVTPDFRLVDLAGAEFDLGQWTALWRHNARSFAMMTHRSAVQSVTMEGDAVLAVVRRESTLELRGSSNRLSYEDIVHDAWVKVGTEWRLRRSVAVQSKPLRRAGRGLIQSDAGAIATSPRQPSRRATRPDAAPGERS